MKKLGLLMVLIIALFNYWQHGHAEPQAVADKPFAALLKIQGGIGPASQDYFERNLQKAVKEGASVAVLQLDTPGGLASAMRGIIKAILSSPIPVLTYVSPSGAHAASAGTYILYASHVAAMAPGTNLGAATPVAIGGNGSDQGDSDRQKSDKKNQDKQKKPSAMESKALNDAKAYIRSLAELRGRNVQWAERAVTHAESLTAQEALKKKVINLIAGNVQELLSKADGLKVQVQQQMQTIQSSQLATRIFKADWRSEFLSVITDPSIAYMLLLAGVYGLIFEFSNPGLIAPGVIGGICLLVGLYALQLLPINYAGLGLMGLGLALMVAEAFMPSFGIVGIGGLIAFAIGSIMLLRTDAVGFTLPLQIILGVTISTGLFFLLMVQLVWRGQRQPVVSGTQTLIGKIGVISVDERDTLVRINGEYWRAEADFPLESGQRVVVESVSGLVLTVAQCPTENGSDQH